jgi:hypothetical protein
VVLVVEEFEHVGSDGSAAFGDPRYIMANPAVKAALDRPPPSSPGKQVASAAGQRPFYSTLGPTDLLFLESTCTQTMKHSQAAFPIVITDVDWRIPAEQARRLAQIDFPRLEPAFTLLSESDVELEIEEEPRRSNGSSSFDAAKRTKVDSANGSSASPRASESSPVRYRIIESSQVASMGPLTQASMGPLTQASMGPLTQAPITQPISQLSPKARVSEPSPKAKAVVSSEAKATANQSLPQDFPDYAEW